ncbi:hypothetical protein AOLI_G00135090 [Acnodon oligacanthus]
MATGGRSLHHLCIPACTATTPRPFKMAARGVERLCVKSQSRVAGVLRFPVLLVWSFSEATAGTGQVGRTWENKSCRDLLFVSVW